MDFANTPYYLTQLQQKCMQIVIDSEKNPQSLLLPEECGQFDKIVSYLKMLLLEKSRLRQFGHANYAIHLIDEEICRLIMAPVSISDMNLLEKCNRESGTVLTGAFTESDDSMHSDDEEVTLTKSVLIPVDAYPTYNFIGRIIGPRGMTAKQLEKDTGCRIMIRGNYSNKTYGYSPRKSISGDEPKEPSESPLRVVIETSGPRGIATARINEALEVVNSLLVPPPDGRDELKRRQLVELAIMNGTYRQTSSSAQFGSQFASEFSEEK